MFRHRSATPAGDADNGEESSGDTIPNAAEPQPKRASARTTNAPRFAVTDVILSAVHPALSARLSRPLVYVSGCYGCRPSAGPERKTIRKSDSSNVTGRLGLGPCN